MALFEQDYVLVKFDLSLARYEKGYRAPPPSQIPDCCDASLLLVLGLLAWLPGKQNLIQRSFESEHWAIVVYDWLVEAEQRLLHPFSLDRLRCPLSAMSFLLLFHGPQEIETCLAFAHRFVAKYLHLYFPNVQGVRTSLIPGGVTPSSDFTALIA